MISIATKLSGLQYDFLDCWADCGPVIRHNPVAIQQILGQSITIMIAKVFAIIHNPNGSRTINEDYRRIVSIAAILIINAEQNIAAIEGEMCVFRHGINHWGRCTIKIAKNGCFHISQSGRNPIFILFNPCRLYQDCKISVDTPVLDDYMVLWLCGLPPWSGPCINTEVLNNCIHLPLLTGGQGLIGSSAMIQSAIIKWHPYMFSANMVFG